MEYVVDINPNKHGKFLPGTGHRIQAPDFVRERPPDVVLVMNPIYCDEIRSSLTELGISPELLPL